MKKLSARLSHELIECGNLPVSAEGLVRLRPEIASDVAEAQSMLGAEFEPAQPDDQEDQSANNTHDFLVARFISGPEGTEQQHLFMMEASEGESQGNRIKRWAKRPVSYGSFVQIQKHLRNAWGDVRNLEIERIRLQLKNQP